MPDQNRLSLVVSEVRRNAARGVEMPPPRPRSGHGSSGESEIDSVANQSRTRTTNTARLSAQFCMVYGSMLTESSCLNY